YAMAKIVKDILVARGSHADPTNRRHNADVVIAAIELFEVEGPVLVGDGGGFARIDNPISVQIEKDLHIREERLLGLTPAIGVEIFEDPAADGEGKKLSRLEPLQRNDWPS